jgi:hypothetical protein
VSQTTTLFFARSCEQNGLGRAGMAKVGGPGSLMLGDVWSK